MIFLYILLGLVLLFLLLLCLPVTVTAGYDTRFYLKLKYAFFPLPTGQKKAPESTGKSKPSEQPAAKKKGIAYFNELFQNNPLPDAISELCGLLRLILEKAMRILRRSVMPRFHLQIVHSNADAAAAAIGYGEICAAVYPFLGFLNSIITFKRQNINILCDYTGGQSCFRLDFKWRVLPIFCIGPLLSFVFDYIKNKGR